MTKPVSPKRKYQRRMTGKRRQLASHVWQNLLTEPDLDAMLQIYRDAKQRQREKTQQHKGEN